MRSWSALERIEKLTTQIVSELPDNVVMYDSKELGLLGSTRGSVIWTNPKAVPELGSVVRVTLNGIGEAEVKMYAISEGEMHDYVGLIVEPKNPPEWYEKQNSRPFRSIVYGSEVSY
jgi:hypothetical protein